MESGSAYQSSSYYRTNPTYPYSLYTYGSPIVKVRQDLPAATINQLKGNYVTFSFWFLSSNDVAKAQLAVYDATYESICHCYIGGWNYYESPWIGASRESGSLAWANVVAHGYVSGAASQAYVRILLAAEVRWGEPKSAINPRGCSVPFLQYVGATSLAAYIYP